MKGANGDADKVKFFFFLIAITHLIYLMIIG